MKVIYKLGITVHDLIDNQECATNFFLCSMNNTSHNYNITEYKSFRELPLRGINCHRITRACRRTANKCISWQDWAVEWTRLMASHPTPPRWQLSVPCVMISYKLKKKVRRFVQQHHKKSFVHGAGLGERDECGLPCYMTAVQVHPWDTG